MSVQVVVVGGGIAGVSAAYACTLVDPTASVILVEAEEQLAHHTTGRSAALLFENYGQPAQRSLTRASLDFLHNTPADLVDSPLVHKRPMIHVGGPEQSMSIDTMLAEGADGTTPTVEITVEEAVNLVPPLRPELIARAVLETGTCDIDVAALHQAFVRGFKLGGGTIATATRVDAVRLNGQGWQIETTTGELQADVVINAAGAWGDVVAQRAGVAPLGLVPKRRTAFMIDAPVSDTTSWAMVGEVDHQWYMKPDGAQLLCSPADETPSEPCDAKAEELDVALAIDRINTATTLGIRSVNSTWAGLRTFTSDGAMAIGPDANHPNFIWCVGQGGTGIQTSRAAGQLTAELTLGATPSPSFSTQDLAALSPDRLRRPR